MLQSAKGRSILNEFSLKRMRVNEMLNRRQFIATGVAATGAAGISPAFAHEYQLPEKFLPREVELSVDMPAGEIHVVPDVYALYWTLGGRRAIRYSVGVGKGDLYHSGTFYVGAKKEWPSWTPTPAMIKRDPEAYEKYADGMPGGIDNPLGARALYLFTPEKGDTYLRIHGTNNPRTIGLDVSNGCARLTNEHIKEFYPKVPLKTKVVLYEKHIGTPLT